MDANSAVTYLKGVGPKRAELYEKLGIKTVGDLIGFYPRSYLDYNEQTPINELVVGEQGVFRAAVTKKLRPHIYAKASIFKVALSDGKTDILAVIFNNEYAYARLTVGEEYIFSGKITGDLLRREVANPLFIPIASEERLVPKYHLTSGLSQSILSKNIHTALENVLPEDNLPNYIKTEFSLLPTKEALWKIHFPHNKEQYAEARKRLVFEELLTLQLGLSMMKSRGKKLTGTIMKSSDISAFYKALPFEPTNAQKRAVSEAMADMVQPSPMNRLLQGDVGSGKTCVAAALCYFAHLNGCQSTVMVPTEILAKQHFATLSEMLEPLGVKCALLTGSLFEKEKRAVKKQLESGEIDIAIGTQALIQKNTVFKKLGLVVTDEQHRFGVGQRSKLAEKGENPHTLVMSATPIPRTLALMIYGDLDISVLDELPKGRVPIKTYGVDSSYRERLYKFVLKYVAQGKQAYIVCPMIDENENEKASATAYYEKLNSGYFKDIPIGLLHGKMPQAEKDAVMLSFKNNETKVLISTTVIEVGVDVPNAVVMLIENAEQFGLSQLHQLRGRVGRGDVQSHCILLTDSDTEYTRARVETMVRTGNGFEIASEDLKLRGPGDFFGRKQSGLPQLRIADMNEDMTTLTQAQELSARVLAADPMLTLPENAGLRRLVKRLFEEREEYIGN